MKRNNLVRKAILLTMSIIMLLTVTGCKGEKVVKSNLKMTENNTYPLVEEKAELSIFVPKQAMIADLETNKFTKWYEEKTNVHINWDIASGDTAQSISLRIASGELPDVFMNSGFSDIQVYNYGEEGLFIDLKDYIDEYAPNLKKILEEREDIRKSITQNGKIYGFFNGGDTTLTYCDNKMWVYEPWLKELGLELPKTTEDFYNMLKAFKEKDPNKNGKQDEIPLAARGVQDNYGIANFLLSSFVYCNSGSVGKWLYVENDKVKYTPIENGYREGLRYIKKLYDEGLLLQDVFVIDRTSLTSMAENDEASVLGAAPGLWAGMFTISGSDSGRIREYVAIEPLEGPSGIRQTANTANSVVPTAFVVTKDCKYPELAVRWADGFYNSELQKQRQGSNGTRPAKEGEIGLDGTQAEWVNIPVEKTSSEFGSVQNENWGQHLGFSHSKQGAFGKKVLLEGDLNAIIYNESKNKYSKYVVDGRYPQIPIDIDMAAEFEDLKETLNDMSINAFAEFITGKRDIDKDWDAYVKEMKNNGVSRFLKLAQERYDKYAK